MKRRRLCNGRKTNLGELHLVHALACVPVEEGLATEHGSELLRYPLEQLLDIHSYITMNRITISHITMNN